MISNHRNEKPRDLVVTKSQGTVKMDDNFNHTTPRDSKSRYEKGMELYKAGRVKVGTNGLFKVSGYYEADTEKMTCTCPDYKTRKEPCKHLFAVMLFVKNRGKQRIEGLDGEKICQRVDKSNGQEIVSRVPQPNLTQKVEESNSKPFDCQSTITRLAVLNTATEILKTHSKPIEFNDIVSLAAQLEKWALGN